MTKQRKNRSNKARRTRPVRFRTMLVVDRVEVGSVHGCLTLRASDVDGEPVGIVVPGESALGLLGQIGQAVLDAEEQYWRVVVPYIQRLNITDPDTVAREMTKWHRTQGWEKAAKHGQLAEETMFLLTNAGHVAIGASPPASMFPVLAIFDPVQLRRISSGMESSAHQALQEKDFRPWNMRAVAAHEFIEARPWRQPGTHRDPAPADAAEFMMQQYEEHLRRSPYIRPDENNLEH